MSESKNYYKTYAGDTQIAYNKVIRVRYPNDEYFNITNVSFVEGTLSLTGISDLDDNRISYSKNKTNWTEITGVRDYSWTLKPFETIYFKGDTNGGRFYGVFNMDVSHSVSGNIFSLIDETNYAEATTMPDESFMSIFSNDYSLVYAKNLNFANVTQVSYSGLTSMFEGCSNLVEAPDCSCFTEIGDYGCDSMFYNCSILKKTPDFSNVSVLGEYSFQNTFYGCSSLETAFDMGSITTFGDYAFYSMYQNCSSLKEIPNLSFAETVTDSCFNCMFSNCTSIETADISYLDSVAQYSYASMFSGCSGLNLVKAPNIQDWDSIYTSGWLYATAENGIFAYGDTIPPKSTYGVPDYWSVVDTDGKLMSPTITYDTLNTVTITEYGGNGCCKIYYTTDGTEPTTSSTLYTKPFELFATCTVKAIVHCDLEGFEWVSDSDSAEYSATYVPIDYFYIENTSGNTGTFTLYKGSFASYNDKNIEYSKDNGDWIQMDLSSSTNIDNVEDGSVIRFRGVCPNGTSSSYSGDYYAYRFTMNCYHKIGGNLTTIIDKYNYDSITTLPNCGYLFSYVGYLVDASDMNFGNVTDIGQYGCQYMFCDCGSLVNAPSMKNISSIGQYGCQYMFRYCSSLVNAPSMENVLRINRDGCSYMFTYCSSLVNAPSMERLNYIDSSGCDRMFNYCTSLVVGADLRSLSSLYGRDSAYYMYGYCSNLKYIGFPDNRMSYSSRWMSDTSQTGVATISVEPYYRDSDGIPSGWAMADRNKVLKSPVITQSDNTITIKDYGGGNTSKFYYTTDGTTPTTSSTLYTEPFDITESCTIKAIAHCDIIGIPEITDSSETTYSATYTPIDYFYIENTSSSTGTINFKKGSPASTSGKSLYYKKNGGNWTSMSISSSNNYIYDVYSGDKVYFRGTAPSGWGGSDEVYSFSFSMNVSHEIGGNIMSLIDSSNYMTMTTMPQNAFSYMFYNDTNLTSAENVNFGQVTSIGDSGLKYTFSGCSSLTTAPDLSSVTSIVDYGLYYTFYGCTSLTTAPDLSNLTSVGNRGLSSAFKNCTSLTTAPDLSSVTSIGNGGLDTTFYGCTNLTTAPDLSSVTSIVDFGLYGAFQNCTSLTTPPDLSSVTSIGNQGLYYTFYGCTNLTTAPDLSSVTSIVNYGLYYTFQDCSKLQYIYAPNVDSWVEPKFAWWVRNAGSQAATPKEMIFQTQALLDACPSGDSGYGGYSKVLA